MSRWPSLPRSSLGLLSIAVAGLLVGLVLWGFSFQHSGPVTATVNGTPRISGGHLEVNLTLASHRPFPVPVRASLLPAVFSTDSEPAYVFADDNFPSLFGTSPEVHALVDHLGQEFQTLGSASTLSTLNSSQLSSFLTGNFTATLVVANYGALPVSVLSAHNNTLGPWIHDGGRLVWAGGPLGYYSIGRNATSHAPYPGGLGPAGQLRLLGYPLTDLARNDTGFTAPTPAPALTGWNSTSYSTGLGLEYNGSLYGANVTELALHGGIDLGYDTSSNTSVAARTSLAYLPDGNGSIFYFGGAVQSPDGAYIPEGGVRLAYDIGQLLSFPLVPLTGPVVTEELNLSGYQQTTLMLSSNSSGEPVGLLVQCTLAGAPLFELAQQVVPASAVNASGARVAFNGVVAITQGAPPGAAGCAGEAGAPSGTPRTCVGRVPPAGGVSRSLQAFQPTSTH